MKEQRAASRGQRRRGDWITASLLISLSPIALLLGLLFAMSDSISRVVGHRGNLLPQLAASRRKRSRPTQVSNQSTSTRPTILITGASPIALALAREFKSLGHQVIISDEEAVTGLNRARYSRAVGRFIPYDKHNRSQWGARTGSTKVYPQQILSIVRNYKIDIWIPCDQWSTDEEKMQAAGVVRLHYPDCLVPFPGPESLDLAWNKFAFSKFVKSLEAGIKTPACTIVQSRGQIHSLLGSKDSKRSLLLTGPVPRDAYSEDFVKNHNWRDSGFSDYSSTSESIIDSLEPDEALVQKSYNLPLQTLDATYDLLSSLPIGRVSTWDAAEPIEGRPCVINALIHDSSLRAFAGVVLRDSIPYPPTYQSIHDKPESAKNEALTALDAKSSLYTSLIRFSELFASKLPAQSLISLSLKFVLVSKATDTGVELRPWAVNCEYGFSNTLLAIPDAAAIWSSTITKLGQKTLPKRALATPSRDQNFDHGTYSAPVALVYSVFVPIWLLITGKSSFAAVLASWHDFVEKILHWREELWSTHDPAPFLWFWGIESPIVVTIRFMCYALTVVGLLSAQT